MVRKGAQKVSRHKKKYWRKGVNIQDVEEYLEEVRKEERQFGKRLVDKTDAELFSVSKRPDHGLMQLNSFKACKDRARKSKTSAKPEGKPSKQRATVVRTSRVQLSRQLAKPQKVVEGEKPPPGYSASFYDIWSKKETNKADKIEDSELKEYYLREVRKKRKPLPKTVGVNESLRRNVELPKPGTSYNPSPEDHKKLLEEVAKSELEKVKKEQKLKRSLEVSRDSIVTPEEKLQELCEGLFPQDEEDDAEVSDDGTNVPLTSVRPKPKTSQKRKRMLKQKLAERARREDKRKKALLQDVYRLRAIKAEINKEQEQSLKRSMLRIKQKYERLRNPHRLGRFKFEPLEEPALLPHELPKSLRHLRATGNLMEERFKSWQLRNILEAQVRQKRTRKYKRVRYERKGCKEVDEDYIPR